GRGLVDAERLRPVVTHVGVEPGDTLVGVAFTDRETQLRALRIRRNVPAVRERPLHDVRGLSHLPPFADLASKVGRDTLGTHREDHPDWEPDLPVLADEPEPNGLGARLAARSDAELAQDRRDVVIDRLRGEDEALGDLRVAKTLGH